MLRGDIPVAHDPPQGQTGRPQPVFPFQEETRGLARKRLFGVDPRARVGSPFSAGAEQDRVLLVHQQQIMFDARPYLGQRTGLYPGHHHAIKGGKALKTVRAFHAGGNINTGGVTVRARAKEQPLPGFNGVSKPGAEMIIVADLAAGPVVVTARDHHALVVHHIDHINPRDFLVLPHQLIEQRAGFVTADGKLYPHILG